MTRNVVLLGIGHTNAQVVRMWRRRPIPDARLVCVSNFPFATYSGMLPGVLARRYAAQQMQIELEPLCRAAGAELRVEEPSRVDLGQRKIHFAGGHTLSFDVLSIGIGSVPATGDARLDDSVLLIKPMQTFVSRVERRLAECQRTAGGRPLRIVVVGGGVGGLEIALCLPATARRVLREIPFTVTIVHAGSRIGPGLLPGTAGLVQRELELRGVQLLLGRRVTQAGGGTVTLDDQRRLAADLVCWMAQASAPPLLQRLGLPTDKRGFLMTRATLQSLGDDRVLAVGDSGSIQGCEVPKAGVFAVRQAPILWANLRRVLRGQPLRPYVPQRGFLKLLNAGDGTAIGEYRGWTFRGRWAWALKDAIDRRFVGQYQISDGDASRRASPGALE